MLLDAMAPFVSTLVLFAGATMFGIAPVRKLIQIREGKRELKQGSAGLIRTTSGWLVIVLWLAATWFVATILGDWWASGDLPGAVDRAWLRMHILLEILAALGDD